ncbi:hypothetical protein VPFG_00018 [Vibrio phage nt-1]|uniref:Uncharacterized protein n=1 Tax=Vibrio phage nt-1 TaxID=115992 RepID=R9TE71_9CAUD|nr:hypothetical protein VPFG_00018 [Vibrio phage nt-1]AGN30026.1 hypothetical protein VPFG_00018 [Vibrio phage nt-1]
MPIVAGDLKFNKSTHVVSAGVGNGNTNEQEIDSLGLAISATELVSGELHGLFDSVISDEALFGRTEYRLIYLLNDHPTLTLYDARVFISSNTISANSEIAIGFDPVAVNGEDSLIALADETDSTTQLSAVTFGTHSTFATGLLVGDLAAGEQRAIWVRRTIDPNAPASNESATITLRGDTNA